MIKLSKEELVNLHRRLNVSYTHKARLNVVYNELVRENLIKPITWKDNKNKKETTYKFNPPLFCFIAYLNLFRACLKQPNFTIEQFLKLGEILQEKRKNEEFIDILSISEFVARTS